MPSLKRVLSLAIWDGALLRAADQRDQNLHCANVNLSHYLIQTDNRFSSFRQFFTEDGLQSSHWQILSHPCNSIPAVTRILAKTCRGSNTLRPIWFMSNPAKVPSDLPFRH
jgi:hypothetical protein